MVRLTAFVPFFLLAGSFSNAQPQSAHPTSTLLWRGASADPHGFISPDGHHISFVDWSTGDLCLHDADTGEDRRIVPTDNPLHGTWKAYAERSAISGDGARVAYSWFDATKDAYELWVANLSGDARPRRLYAPPEVAWIEPRDWSPDGKWVAIFAEFNDRTQRLGLVSTNDGRFRALKTSRWPGGGNMFFSPDGAHLAYDFPQGATTARDVWLIATDGTSDVPVVTSRSDDSVMGWSPDGKHLLFASDRTGAMTLWALRIADGKPLGEPKCLKSDWALVAPMGITKAGALVYGTLPGRRGGSIQLGGFDIESGAVHFPHDVSTNPQEDNVNPAWSPDGTFLAYLTERGNPGAIPVIVLRFAESGALDREIEPKLRRAQLAGWQPDGMALLAVGADFSGHVGAFRIDAETGDASFLFATPMGPTLSRPVWSADGRALYYWSRVPASSEQVFKARDIASGAEKEILRRPFLGELNTSPDGRWLATESIKPETGERVLLLLSLETGTCREVMSVPAGVKEQELRNVAGAGARIYPASWAPDSRSFIARLQRQPEGESELWAVPIEGTPRKLRSSLEAHVFAFKISPDGRRVAYRYKEPGPLSEPQVWKLENFLPAK